MGDLEKRTVKEREDSQFKQLREVIKNAKLNSKGWKKIIGDVDHNEIINKESLSKLPITRKSLLSNLQNDISPFGGLTTIKANQFKNIFVSPGPIYEPGGDNDFWRMSRAMKAAGFKKGEILYNTFSYHLKKLLSLQHL